MFISERIFEELEVVEPNMFDDYNSHDVWSDTYWDIKMKLAEKEISDEKENYDNEDEWLDRIDEEVNSVIRAVRFKGEGLLALALNNYYGGHEAMIDGIRSCIDNYSEDGYIYYVTGIGYDTISADLLNGNSDGKAKYKFIAEINKDNDDKNRVKQYERMAK